jgi:hypothetical protein
MDRSVKRFIRSALTVCVLLALSVKPALAQWDYTGTLRMQGTLRDDTGCVYDRVLEGISLNGTDSPSRVSLPFDPFGVDAVFALRMTDTVTFAPPNTPCGTAGIVGLGFGIQNIHVDGYSVTGRQASVIGNVDDSIVTLDALLSTDLQAVSGTIAVEFPTIRRGSLSGQFTFNVTFKRPLVTIPPSLPNANLEEPYSATDYLRADGGFPPYTWTLSPLSTPLPPGLTIATSSDVGTISGTVDALAETNQSFNRIDRRFRFTVAVTDRAGQTVNTPLSIKIKCGELDRDNLIDQYREYDHGNGVIDGESKAQFVPRCIDMTQTAGSPPYSFIDLNLDNETVPTVALLRESMLTGAGVSSTGPAPILTFRFVGLPGLILNYGGVPVRPGPCAVTCLVNSGFRPPQDHVRIYATLNQTLAKNSRHMFGDAIDLPNPDADNPDLKKKRATWAALVNAALNSGADYVENVLPQDSGRLCGPIKMRCVHADWRTAAAPYAK